MYNLYKIDASLCRSHADLFRNPNQQVCFYTDQLEQEKNKIQNEPGFEDFVKKLDPQKIQNMKNQDDYKQAFDMIKNEYQNFKTPEIGVNM